MLWGSKVILDSKKWWYYITLSIVCCVVAIGAGSWLGVAKRRAKVPRGYEETNIPGIFVRDRIADLGMISPNRLVDMTFDLFNSSKNTYIVKHVSASCGCATINLTEQVLQPDSSLAIPVKMDASKLGGNVFKKGVLVELAHQGQEKNWKDVFHLKGTIDRSGTFTVWPGILDYGDTVVEANLKRMIYFKADEALLKVLPSVIEITHKSEAINLPRIDYSGILQIKSVEVRLTIPIDTVTGVFKSLITVEVAGSPPRLLVIPVQARVVDDINVIPERIFMTVSDEENCNSVDLTLRSVTGKQISVKEISSSLPLQWLIKKDAASNSTLIITFMPDESVHSNKSLCGDIQIEMSDNKKHIVPVVLIPLNYSAQVQTDITEIR